MLSDDMLRPSLMNIMDRALLCAMMGSKDSETIAVLLKHGANVMEVTMIIAVSDTWDAFDKVLKDMKVSMDDALVYAAKHGHDDACTSIIERGVSDIHAALLAAIHYNQMHVCETLLDYPQCDLEHALSYAACVGRVQLTEYLLHYGATDISTALYSASARGHLRICDLLVSYVSRENMYDMMDIVLYGAVMGRRLEVCKFAIENGARDISHCLYVACKMGSADICSYLGRFTPHKTVSNLLKYIVVDPKIASVLRRCN
jgi:hypothetical protein